MNYNSKIQIEIVMTLIRLMKSDSNFFRFKLLAFTGDLKSLRIQIFYANKLLKNQL